MHADADRAFLVLKEGGIVIIPADVGYAIVTCDENALEKIFKRKGRGAHKRSVYTNVQEIEPFTNCAISFLDMLFLVTGRSTMNFILWSPKKRRCYALWSM